MLRDLIVVNADLATLSYQERDSPAQINTRQPGGPVSRSVPPSPAPTPVPPPLPPSAPASPPPGEFGSPAQDPFTTAGRGLRALGTGHAPRRALRQFGQPGGSQFGQPTPAFDAPAPTPPAVQPPATPAPAAPAPPVAQQAPTTPPAPVTQPAQAAPAPEFDVARPGSPVQEERLAGGALLVYGAARLYLMDMFFMDSSAPNGGAIAAAGPGAQVHMVEGAIVNSFANRTGGAPTPLATPRLLVFRHGAGRLRFRGACRRDLRGRGRADEPHADVRLQQPRRRRHRRARR